MHSPDLVCWTGDLETGVSRDELLQLLAEPIADSNVLVWGIECNRAVRKLYPEVHTKRKGKYKTYPFVRFPEKGAIASKYARNRCKLVEPFE